VLIERAKGRGQREQKCQKSKIENHHSEPKVILKNRKLMMSKILCFVVLIFGLFGCSDSSNNGAVTSDTLYYANGNISDIYNRIDGKLNGYSYFFYESGELESKLHFKEDVQDDSCFTFFKSGRIRSSYLSEDGLVEGPCVVFYESGDTMEFGEFYGSMKSGLWIYFDTIGNKIQTLNGDTIK